MRSPEGGDRNDESQKTGQGAGPSAPPSSTLVGASFVECNDKGEIKKVRYTSMAKYLIEEHGACLVNMQPAWLRYPEGDPECDGLYDAGEDAIVEVCQTYVPDVSPGPQEHDAVDLDLLFPVRDAGTTRPDTPTAGLEL